MQNLFRTLPGLVEKIEADVLLREALVFAAWRRIEGELLSEQTAPVRLEEKRLIVAVSSITWQKHLADLSGQMLFKINAELGTSLVGFIEFVIDPKAVKTERKKRSLSNNPSESFDTRALDEVSPELAISASAIGDDHLRHQFLLAAGKCLLRRERIAD